jgi:apolipoprotein N-acyltransferase
MPKLSKLHLFLLSISSGILLSVAWPERGFAGLLFIGLVPLLMVEEYIASRREDFFRFSVMVYSFPGFLLWNGLTTWWIYNSTGIGAILAVVLNSLFMAIVFQIFHFSRIKLRNRYAGYASLLFYWISFEYLHLNWDLNWPWLNLGNGFASYYHWVQWYEYTGALGGTLWVLTANILAFRFSLFVYYRWVSKDSTSKIENRKSKIEWLMPLALILWFLGPILLSYYIYSSYQEKKNPVNVVVVQPNLDPYNEQYNLPPREVINRIIQLTRPKLDSSIDFLVAPESAIQQEMWENDLEPFESIVILKEIVSEYPNLNLLVGGSTFYAFQPGEKVSSKARKFTKEDAYYNVYNTAIMVNNSGKLQLYHKSKLTPGVESLPSYPGFDWLEKYAIDLGGIVGSLGIDSVRKVYTTVGSVPVGPIICYESIFGEFFAEFVRNGAEVMFIITNDGWWGNTGGYRQHFSFAHLRAIETRRSIARSANTGISAFIDQRGDASQATEYWVPAVIKGNINANTTMTFYVRHGDYIARYAVICALITLGGSIVLGFTRRRKL